MPFSLIPLLLIIVPIAEIAAFILIGGEIGVFPTLGLVFITAIVGTALLRWQGLGLLNRIKSETEAGRLPGRDLVHGVMIMIAGVLLLTPGFVTDTLGFLLFVPAVRDWAWNHLKSRITVVASNTSFSTGRGPAEPNNRDGKGPVVDLDEGEFTRKSDPNSPWSSEDKPLKDNRAKDRDSDDGL